MDMYNWKVSHQSRTETEAGWLNFESDKRVCIDMTWDIAPTSQILILLLNAVKLESREEEKGKKKKKMKVVIQPQKEK